LEHTTPLVELGRTILAYIARSSLAGALAHESGANRKVIKRARAILPVGEDLISYLRSLKRWLITKEVAALLHCHTETIYRRIEHEKLPARRDGKRWKFDPAEIADWVERRSAIAAGPVAKSEVQSEAN